MNEMAVSKGTWTEYRYKDSGSEFVRSGCNGDGLEMGGRDLGISKLDKRPAGRKCKKLLKVV